ncbi:MAG: type II secretion system F family protein [Selenomonadaceae bacterium]|nr:type II secretion system F family protein [Selenomonadaceae bacterium]
MLVKVLFSVSVTVFLFTTCYLLVKKNIEAKKQIAQRIRNLDEAELAKQQKAELEYKKAKATSLKEIPFVERVVIPFKQWLERTVMSIAPKEIQMHIQKRLTTAGKYPQWTVSMFLIVDLVMAMFGVFLGVDLSGKQEMAPIQRIVAMFLGCLVGGLMPFSILNIITQKRQKAIQKQLPELLDLLCVSVQAGLSFDGAMRKIVERMEGPLIDECRKMLDDIRMGAVRRQALRLMGERCDVQDVALFTTAVIQAERLGTSMATTLNNQAENMRERRRQYIKAEALKAPVKIVFPLIMFIFPALFVVTLLPAILGLSDSMILGK